MAVKNKIEKVGGLTGAVPEKERPVIPEEKPEAERPFVPEAEKRPPEVVKKEEKPAVTAVVTPIVARPAKSEGLIKIEKILEEDLEEFYFSMPEEKRAEFKAKGEEAASKIEQMVEAGKIVARKILKLIRAWLKLIPGVNKFFLEQAAKIKTDKVMAMAEKEKQEL